MLKLLWDLYRIFFGMGAITFGGGYAMLPLLQRTVVQKYGWTTDEELLDYYAIGQCTPGIIAVNTATFVGYKQGGALGGIIATLGIISPALIIITAIAALLRNFMDVVWVQHAFAGIRIAVSALIVSTLIGMIRKNVRSWLQIVLCLSAFILVAFFKTPVTYIVLATALLGIMTYKEESAK
ncbi:MAG: chromate transporter [Clostridiales bacterium]|jgi:chromate transporter|nr:chromate transporter [Bacillota bacterium]NLL55389.1 chromate transporter [Clostridiales bacterium]